MTPLSGLTLNEYPDDLAELMSRLMVAPMATRFLFWKKIQSLNGLRQRLMDDRALERQLKDIAWSAAFEAPSSSLRPETASRATRRPSAPKPAVVHSRSAWLPPPAPHDRAPPIQMGRMSLQPRPSAAASRPPATDAVHGADAPVLQLPAPLLRHRQPTVLMMSAEDAARMGDGGAAEPSPEDGRLVARHNQLLALRERMREASAAAALHQVGLGFRV